jgi:ABC-type polysaccharide/polyol phosphate export permease
MTPRRFLLKELVTRDLRARYAESLFGFLWAFATPLWQLGLYSIVFSLILRIPLTGEATDSFAAFLFAGLLPWIAFSEGISRGATSVVENASLVKKHAFPSELLVVSVTLSALAHAGIAFVVFVGFRAFSGTLVWAQLPVLLLGVVLQIALTLGLGWMLATVHVYLRDVQHGLALVLSAVFYLTPMIYPVALVPERFRWAVEANPLSTVVGAYRAFLLGSAPPRAWQLAVLAAAALAAFVGGLALFRRSARDFSDEL